MSTFPADVAAAARAVAARRLFLPLCQLGAGSRRAPSSRAACAPLSPRDITSLLASAMRTPRATARDHVDLSCRRRRCRPRRCCASTLLAPLPARCRLTPRAERAHLLRSLVTIVTSPRALCDTHHCAAAQEPVDLPRRRRCCRLRRRGASMLLALLRSRRRPLPRAERARLLRAPVTTVTSPCVLCAAHHRAASQERVDLLRRRRRCRPRRRGASALLALLRARRQPSPRAE